VVTAAGAAVAVSLGSGIASASPSVWGKTYAEAAAALKNAGFTPVVAVKVGDRLAQYDRLVTGQVDESTPTFGNKKYAINHAKTVLLTLNCYPTPASPTEPGYSAADPNAAWLKNRNAAIAAQAPEK
jgi:hypothetical protein